MADLNKTPSYDILTEASKELKEAEKHLKKIDKNIFAALALQNIQFAMFAIDSKKEANGKVK